MTLLFTQAITAQVNIVVTPDSVYQELPAIESEISLPSHITNNSGSPVTIRWTRVIEQETAGWDHAFCDKNLCYFGTVNSKTFELANGEEGLLKPIFYPYEIAGVGVMRLYYLSETPGVSWADTAVYVAVGTELVGTMEVERVRDMTVFPNPTQNTLTVVFADVNFMGKIEITNAQGTEVLQQNVVSANEQLDIARFPAGMYVLRALSTNGRTVAVRQFSKI